VCGLARKGLGLVGGQKQNDPRASPSPGPHPPPAAGQRSEPRTAPSTAGTVQHRGQRSESPAFRLGFSRSLGGLFCFL